METISIGVTLWAAATAPPKDSDRAAMEVLTSRVLLRSPEPAALEEFYRHRLGLAVAREYPGGVVFHAGNGLIEVPTHMSGDPAAEWVPHSVLWLQVRDMSVAEAELRAADVPITREARTEPWGLIEMHIADPDGRTLIIVQIPDDHPLRRDLRPTPGARADADPVTD